MKSSELVEMKSSELDPNSDSYSKMDKGKHIINVEPSSTISTTKIQPEDIEEPEEGECLFHSQMWVNGVPLHFIVHNGIQKKLISAEVVR